MPTVKYRAMTSSGSETIGEIKARSKNELCKKLELKGESLISIIKIIDATGPVKIDKKFIDKKHKHATCGTGNNNKQAEGYNGFKSPKGEESNLKPKMICPHCQTKGRVYVKTEHHVDAIEYSGSEKLGAAFASFGLVALLGNPGPKDYKVKYYNIATCKNCDISWNLGEVIKS